MLTIIVSLIFLSRDAVHFRAKHGIAIACRLSVCPSICNVGGSGSHSLGWKSCRQIAWKTSPLLFISERPST